MGRRRHRALRGVRAALQAGAHPRWSAWKGRRTQIRRWSACPDLPPDLTFEEQYRPAISARDSASGPRGSTSFSSRSWRSTGAFSSSRREPCDCRATGKATDRALSCSTRWCARAAGRCSRSTSPTKASTARGKVCSSATQLIANDSVSALHALTQIVSKQIDLLYLEFVRPRPEQSVAERDPSCAGADRRSVP